MVPTPWTTFGYADVWPSSGYVVSGMHICRATSRKADSSGMFQLDRLVLSGLRRPTLKKLCPLTWWPWLLGKDEMEQLDLIFKLCGSPGVDDWPDFQELPWSEKLVLWTIINPALILIIQVKEVYKAKTVSTTNTRSFSPVPLGNLSMLSFEFSLIINDQVECTNPRWWSSSAESSKPNISQRCPRLRLFLGGANALWFAGPSKIWTISKISNSKTPTGEIALSTYVALLCPTEPACWNAFTFVPARS